jgi:Ca2+-transporting ATPase
MRCDEVLEHFHTDMSTGLDEYEIKRRQKLGLNILETGAAVNPFRIFISQFTDTMVLVLLGATAISAIAGSIADAATIMAIVIVNAVLGFVQEYRAEKSMDEINKMAAPHAFVLRKGARKKIPARDLVAGDIVFIETGDKIPADLRILESAGLEADEAFLTGESLPVAKNSEVLRNKEFALAEQSNMAFMGSAVTRGHGLAVVVNTGMNTVMGEIAVMIGGSADSLTPLQIKLNDLGKTLIIICLAVCGTVAGMGVLRGENIFNMFMSGISLAVAAIPEGLPAIVTVVLAVGVQRLSKRNAIVRKLSAVETLGCTDVICSDKTGTLTENKMRVVKIATVEKQFSVDGNGYEARGKIYCEGREVNTDEEPCLRQVADIAANCNNAALEKYKNTHRVYGDPTEGALLVMAIKAGRKNKYRRWFEIPFDSRRKCMSVGVWAAGKATVFAKGAPEVILAACSQVADGHILRPLNEFYRDRLKAIQEEWGNEGIRVLAVAAKPWHGKTEITDERELEKDLIFYGLCGLIDPPRPGVAQAVRQCREAGIIPVMITGDHPSTAAAVAKAIGLAENGTVVTGLEIDGMSDGSLYKNIIDNRVFARVSPQHKNRIVKVLQKQKHIVAMTGDGVNDAPAVKAADIGIAMGVSGTEVTKEASAMILADDDFSTIIASVYEGRAIYNNIRKFIRYLLGCNIGEVLVMFVASLLGMPLPLLPIQILWVNLVTDGLPAMALGLEPPEPGIMSKKPRPASESIFARGLGYKLAGRGIYIAAVTLLAFTGGLVSNRLAGDQSMFLPYTMSITALVFAQLFFVFECRSEEHSPFDLGFFTNKLLLAAVLISIIMHSSVIYSAPLQAVFHTTGLSLWHWLFIIILTGPKFLFKLIMYFSQSVLKLRDSYAKMNN